MGTPGEGTAGGQDVGERSGQLFEVVSGMKGMKKREDPGEETWPRRCLHVSKSSGPFSAHPNARLSAFTEGFLLASLTPFSSTFPPSL